MAENHNVSDDTLDLDITDDLTVEDANEPSTSNIVKTENEIMEITTVNANTCNESEWKVVPSRKKKNLYNVQFELRNGPRVYLVYRTFNAECCDWNPFNSRFLLRIPFAVPLEPEATKYTYAAAQFYVRRPDVLFSLDLHPRYLSFFDVNKLRLERNFFKIPIIKSEEGMPNIEKGKILGFLYVTEKWHKHMYRGKLGPSLYCALCNEVGHEARKCSKSKPITAWKPQKIEF